MLTFVDDVGYTNGTATITARARTAASELSFASQRAAGTTSTTTTTAMTMPRALLKRECIDMWKVSCRDFVPFVDDVLLLKRYDNRHRYTEPPFHP